MPSKKEIKQHALEVSVMFREAECPCCDFHVAAFEEGHADDAIFVLSVHGPLDDARKERISDAIGVMLSECGSPDPAVAKIGSGHMVQ